jgi:hypothetical protein
MPLVDISIQFVIDWVCVIRFEDVKYYVSTGFGMRITPHSKLNTHHSLVSFRQVSYIF